jgi:hypothetical protein
MRDRIGYVLAALLAGVGPWSAFGQKPDPLVETGKVVVDGKVTPYLIRNLPVSSFPNMSPAVATSLNAMGCLIPQTYEAHRPENVVHASLERPGSDDWAVLCAVQGKVSLLIFFGGSPADKPIILKAFTETDRLQPHGGNGQLGFNWGIDPASPEKVREAQAGMKHRPPMLDHDCVADTILDRRTVYRFYRNGAWETEETE